MMARALLPVLLRRELAGAAAGQRLLVTAAIGLLCGALAARAPAGVAPRGLLASVLADYGTVATFTAGLLGGTRLIAWRFEDERAGWLTQLFAAAADRAGFVLALSAAVLLGTWLQLLLALAAFAGGSTLVSTRALPAWRHSLPAAALPWLTAVIALAALCALVLDERARGRFVFAMLLLLPYLATFLFAFLHDDRPLPRVIAAALLYGVPLWSPALTPRHFGMLLLYTTLASCVTRWLAPARIGRQT